MIDPDLLEKNPIAKEAFKLLAESNILRQQQAADQLRIMKGDPDEDDRDLIRAIKKFRRRAGIYESLHLLGEDLQRKGEQ